MNNHSSNGPFMAVYVINVLNDGIKSVVYVSATSFLVTLNDSAKVTIAIRLL